jgi:hypothetical protein
MVPRTSRLLTYLTSLSYAILDFLFVLAPKGTGVRRA